jgi:hypothetical protein
MPAMKLRLTGIENVFDAAEYDLRQGQNKNAVSSRRSLRSWRRMIPAPPQAKWQSESE